MFDDPIVEIQELTALVKNDITALNVALTDLQTIQNMEVANGNYSEDKVVHSTAVCDDLKSRLMRATKQLQDVLTTRTEVGANLICNCLLLIISFFSLMHPCILSFVTHRISKLMRTESRYFPQMHLEKTHSSSLPEM